MWLLSGCAKLPCTLYFMGAVQATKTDQFSCLKSPLLQWKAQSSSAQSLVKLFPFLWMGGFWQLNISWGRKLNVKAQLSLPHVHPFPPLTPHPLLTPFLSGCTLYSMKLLWLSPLCPNSKVLTVSWYMKLLSFTGTFYVNLFSWCVVDLDLVRVFKKTNK